MPIEIRPVESDELPAYIDSLSTTFLDRPDVDKVAAEVRDVWSLERTIAAFDGRQVVGTFRSFDTELTVPGAVQLPASAVSAVTVLPTHRRRGLLRQFVAREHARARERGEAIAILYAAEYPIYGRFGYGPATSTATWTLTTAATRFTGPGGGVELVRAADAPATLQTVFDADRVRRPGEVRRREYRWQFDLGLRVPSWGDRWKGNVALHRDAAGEVDGYARYSPKEVWEERQPRGTIALNELIALTDEAYGALWRFLGELDLVATVKAEGRRRDERLPWLLSNARAAVETDVGDGLWVRLLDVPRALEARAYERPGSIVLEVVDHEAPGGRLRLALEVSEPGTRASVRPTDQPPDVTLDVAALGAAYLGGTRLSHAVVPHGFTEHRPGALARAEALFRTAEEPWSATFF
jgi:predicted acetyltransferase